MKSLVQLEHLALLDEQADALQQDFVNGHLKGMYDKVGAIARRNSSTVKTVRVVDKNGLPTQDGIQEAQVFQEHYCKITNGTIVPFEQLVNKDRNSNDCKFDGLTSEGLWNIFPTVSDIHHRYLRMKNDKAGGECNVITNVHIFFAVPCQGGLAFAC